MVEYLAAADLFLFPTERDEAAPLVPLEAMAAGLPVLASRVGGGVELIDDGTSGLLLPPAQAAQVGGGDSLTARRRCAPRQMGKAARERILRSYTIETMTHQTVDVYEIAAERLSKDG